MTRDQAVKKVEIAIDKLIDLQQDYPKAKEFGYIIQTTLDNLNGLCNKLRG